MNVIPPSPTVLVSLRESTVAMLMALRSDDETLDAVTARCADLARNASPNEKAPVPVLAPPVPASIAPPVVSTTSTWPASTSGTYVASVLGEPVGADMAPLYGSMRPCKR